MSATRPTRRNRRAQVCRLALAAATIAGLTVNAAASQPRRASAAPLRTVSVATPPPSAAQGLDIAAPPGLAWSASGSGSTRQAVCDLAAHAQVTMGLPMERDPVFGRPAEGSRLALATLLRRVEALGAPAVAAPGAAPTVAVAATTGPLASTTRPASARGAAPTAATESTAIDAALGSLLATPEGPGLLREGLRVATPGWRSRLLRAGAPLARAHPRLCGFVHNEPRAADPALAAAASAFLLRSDCDSPALFGADGLRHIDPAVRATTIDEIADFLRRNSDIGLLQRLQNAYSSERSAALRVRILRHVSRLQAPGSAELLPAAERDRDPAVRAEALVLRAAVARDLEPRLLERAWGSAVPLVRAAAVRAVAVIANRPRLRRLAMAVGDRGVFFDAVTGERSTVGALATALSASLAAP